MCALFTRVIIYAVFLSFVILMFNLLLLHALYFFNLFPIIICGDEQQPIIIICIVSPGFHPVIFYTVEASHSLLNFNLLSPLSS